MIKYRTTKSFTDIDAMHVVRETEKCVFMMNWNGREVRELKQSDWHQFHDTWEDAHNHLISQAKQKIRSCESQLKFAKEQLTKVKSMEQADD